MIITSIRYFGEKNFEASILELCEEEQLNDLERKWIAKLDATNPDVGYNQLLGLKSPYSTLANARKSISHMGLKASSDSKRKRSNSVIALGPEGFILADSGKLLGDYLGTTKDMIKNCLRQPSRFKGWYIFYDDITKRMVIKDKMLRKRSIRNPEYMEYLSILDEYEFESVETIYAFVRANIGKFYQLDYDFIDENGVPYLLEVFCDDEGKLYTKNPNESESSSN